MPPAERGGARAQAAAAATVPLIELCEVSRVFGAGAAAVRALDRVNLRLAQGEFAAIMGPSGSGKSTAMNVIGCLDTVSSGRFLFRGCDVTRLERPRRALLRRRFIAFVFQGFHLLGRTSALEQVELPLVYRGEPPAARRARARAALARVGLAGRERHTPGELSGGEQQRVAIARAIAAEPALLLADEPTGNLDARTARDIMELLVALNRERGMTVLMVTHAPEMAEYADRVIHFADGRASSGGPDPRLA